ncbi:hypothetical protein GGF46_002167 [Coemansia sp. RSA 552]|nr:hypothetical protein GGF46_002167 [Coemansia sp. RSA 552]
MAPSEEESSPKRFKANVRDQSALPASILKDEPQNEEEPADRTERRKSRKSLGRRVSFAPTAHVRMFEIPEEKKQSGAGNNTFVMPDISSQAGMLGFDLGTLSSVDETSMTSNESFDVSVRHSDPSESLQSSESSFMAGGTSADGAYAELLDDDDDDEDDDADLDEDAVTMELTGTVDMGAISNDGDDDDEEEESDAGANSAAEPNNAAPLSAQGTDTENFFSMLMQSSAMDQQTSLLDNIISQFGQDQAPPSATESTMHSTTETDITRVGIPMDGDQDTTMFVSSTEVPPGDSDSSDGDGAENDNDDAVTMELTGLVPRAPDDDDDDSVEDPEEAVHSPSTPVRTSVAAQPRGHPSMSGPAWGQAVSARFGDPLGSILSLVQSSTQLAPVTQAAVVASPQPEATAAQVTSTPVRQPRTPRTTPRRIPAPQILSSTPTSSSTPKRNLPQTPVIRSAQRGRTSLASTPQGAVQTPLKSARVSRRTPSPKAPTPAKDPVFTLDPLPRLPVLADPPAANASADPQSLAEQAKAGLALEIFDAYRRLQLVPAASPEIAEQSVFPVKFQPLFRKAQLTARLEYCSALNGLFEADGNVRQAAEAEPVTYDPLASFFEDQNETLSRRTEELRLRIAKVKQKLAQAAPGVDSGKVATEIQELRAKLLGVRRERESVGAAVERLNAEIQTLQSTCTSFDHQISEKKSAQDILLSINGLEPADVTKDSCDFVYDKFSKLHFGTSAELTSLHPDIDWSAVVRSSIDASGLSMRQYTIAVMKANAILKGLLEDVRQVKLRTFVDLVYDSGIRIRVRFFSKALRRRFDLQIPLATIDSYARLHKETEFEWPADVLYGDVDEERLKECLQSCSIDPSSPVLSIYQHIDSSMEAF